MWAALVRVGTENTTVAVFGLQPNAAAFARIEIQARCRRDFLDSAMLAGWSNATEWIGMLRASSRLTHPVSALHRGRRPTLSIQWVGNVRGAPRSLHELARFRLELGFAAFRAEVIGLPSYSLEPAAFAGSTCMPHTTSYAIGFSSRL
jgi:hypothetical protein